MIAHESWWIYRALSYSTCSYTSSHIRGSVENGSLEDELSLQNGDVPLNHDSGRKSTQKPHPMAKHNKKCLAICFLGYDLRIPVTRHQCLGRPYGDSVSKLLILPTWGSVASGFFPHPTYQLRYHEHWQLSRRLATHINLAFRWISYVMKTWGGIDRWNKNMWLSGEPEAIHLKIVPVSV